ERDVLACCVERNKVGLTAPLIHMNLVDEAVRYCQLIHVGRDSSLRSLVEWKAVNPAAVDEEMVRGQIRAWFNQGDAQRDEIAVIGLPRTGPGDLDAHQRPVMRAACGGDDAGVDRVGGDHFG